MKSNFTYIFHLGISYEELKNNLLNGFRLTNPKYSPPEISHMVQTCWLPDPKERPTFTTLKQIAWESVFASQRESEGAINIFSSTVSINKRPNRRYKKMRKCRSVDQKHKSLGTDKWETNCESGNSMVTQCYADLDLALLKNVPKNDSVFNQSIIQSCEKEKEEMDIRKAPDKSDILEDITMHGNIKLVRVIVKSFLQCSLSTFCHLQYSFLIYKTKSWFISGTTKQV